MKSTVTAIFVVFVLLGIVGCGNQSGDQDAGQPQRPDPPAVSLQEAVVVGNLAAVRQHIAAGSDLDVKDAYGSTALIVAATFGATDAAIALIDGGADLNTTNNEGSTPLHISAFFCHAEIVEALLAAGADVNATNNDGRTALQSVEGAFEDLRPVYEQLGADLGPLGLQLDYEHIEASRPLIAEMLRS